MVLSPTTSSFLTRIVCDLDSVEYLREILWKFPRTFLCSSLSSPVPCSVNSSDLDLLGLSTQGVQQVPPNFPHPVPLPDISLKTVTWYNHIIHFFFNHLLGIPVLCCLMSNVLKDLALYILPSFLFLFSLSIANLFPVTLSYSRQCICYFLFITLCSRNSLICLYTSSNALPVPIQ